MVDMIGPVCWPLNVLIVVGKSSRELAKIAGITPDGFTLTGRWLFCASAIFMPIWRRGYWIVIFRSARSMKTTNVITAMTMMITPTITAGLMAPERPDAKNWASAAGTSAMMPTKMISEMPLPTPRAVICSPSHMRNMVPPTNVITQEARKNHPGSVTRSPASRLTARPYA